MMHRARLLFLSAGLAAAAPNFSVNRAPMSGDIVQNTQAYYYPQPTPAPSLKKREIETPPEMITFTIVNMRDSPISTYHASNPGAPEPSGVDFNPGTMDASATAEFAVETGWAGNVQICDASNTISGSDSVLEGSFEVQYPEVGLAILDVDVSYV
jgi:hypothetical protein